MSEAVKTLLFVHASADLYGSDVTLLQLVRGLDRERFHAVVALPYEGPLVPRLREAGAEVIVQEDLPIIRRQYMNPRGLLRLAASMKSVWWLSRLIRQRGVALVHGNTLAAVPLGLAAKLAGRPQVWHVHEITTKPRAVASALATLSSALSTRVIANSRATAEHYRRTRLVGSTPVEVILNGVEDDHVHGRQEVSPELQEYADSEDTVFTLLGRINHWKGQSVFLDAAEWLAVDSEEAEFLIVGDSFAGQEHFTEAVDRRIESSEILRDRAARLPYAPAGAVYRASDVVVVPSIEPEPFGLVAAEAMAAGLPVIASRIGALPEIVEDGVNGLLVDPNDPGSLAAAMERLQSSPSLRDEMGRRGRETFKEKFRAGRYVEEFARAYEEIIARTEDPMRASEPSGSGTYETCGNKPVAFCGTRGLPANYGGFETAVDEISRRFVAAGQECVVFCRRSSGESWPDSHEGRRLKYVSGSRRRSLDTFISAFQTGWHLLRHREEYGYVFWFNNANLPGILLTLLARIPLAVNTDGLEWRRAKWKKPFKLYYFLSSALVSILCRDLISDSRAIQGYYRRTFSKRTWFIPYGVPQTPTPSPGREAEILDSYGVEPGCYFLQITRFEPDNLPLEAAHAFRESGLGEAGYRLLLVGRQHDTPYTQRIANLSGEGGVRVAAAVYDPEVISALRNNCFCYVHGNSVGGTNPALLEAMASCARVLAVEGPFSREVLGETGMYFDPDGLVSALRSATQSPENREALSARVHHYYRWDAVARSYLELAKRKLDTKDTEDPKRGAHRSSVGR